jgi:hypothetical protein
MRGLLWLFLLGFSTLAQAEPWHRVGVEDGVTLEMRDVPGSDLPEFRGTAVLPAALYAVAGVVDDLDRFCEWNARCIKNREYVHVSESERIFYMRSGAPWPLDDRDALLHGVVTGLGTNEITVRFEAIRDARWPPLPDAVRMPAVHGSWKMTRVTDTSTRVEYQVLADPGGHIPAWAARMTAKQVPRDTLARLRRHLPKVQGRYQAYIERWTKPSPQ